MSFKFLNNTELWDYQYTSYSTPLETTCQKHCTTNPLCAGYKFYPSTFSNALYKSKCYLYYWIQESTKTAMPGMVSAVRIDAPIRDKYCFSNYTLSPIGCNYNNPLVTYSTLNAAIAKCNSDKTCIAAEIDDNQKFAAVAVMPKLTDAACISFLQLNIGIQISYFTKDGDKSVCNGICGIGDNFLKPCSGIPQAITTTEEAPPVPPFHPAAANTSSTAFIIAGCSIAVFMLISYFIVRRITRVKKGLSTVLSITTPAVERNDKNRLPFEYDK